MLVPRAMWCKDPIKIQYKENERRTVGGSVFRRRARESQLSSVQSVPFVGLRDGHYPPEALPTIIYSSIMTLHQGPQQLLLVNYGPAHRRHSRLCLSRECRGSRRHFLESFLSHHRSSVRRINRWRDSFP